MAKPRRLEKSVPRSVELRKKTDESLPLNVSVSTAGHRSNESSQQDSGGAKRKEACTRRLLTLNR